MFNTNVRKKGAKMIIGNEWKPLLDEYESACDEEAITIKALNKAVKAGLDDEKLSDLTKQWEEAHNKKMDIYKKLEQHRLDKK